MRTAAQVAPNSFPSAGIEVVVGRQLVAPDLHDVGIAGLVVDQLELVGLAGELGAGGVFGLIDPPGEQLAVFDDGLHPLLQRLEVFGGEGGRHVEVVVEAVGNRRADAELRIGEQFLDGLGEHVGGRVTDDAAALVAVGGHRDHLGIGLRGPAQIAQLALWVADHDDRPGLAAAGQAGVAHGRSRGSPGRDLEQVGRCGVCGGAHRRLFRGSSDRRQSATVATMLSRRLTRVRLAADAEPSP